MALFHLGFDEKELSELGAKFTATEIGKEKS